jgi:DNA-binding beta-propeller fold protein YncE
MPAILALPIHDLGGREKSFIADIGLNAIFGYQAVGGAPTYILSSGISVPEGFTLDKKGQLYVANTGTSQILVFSPPATTPVLTIADPDGLRVAVAVDKSGNIWVANKTTNSSAGSLAV